MKTVYADYQATTPVDPRVLNRMAPLWREEFGNPHSIGHVMGWRAAERVNESAAEVAALLGADADEVVFTSGATEANNLALLGLARRAPAGRRRILVSAIEHKCVLAAARALEEREGFVVETIPVDGEGFVRIDMLEALLDEDVLVASIMAVNNEIGTIQDIATISQMLRRHGVLFHCDAAQAPCAMDLEEVAAQADLVSLSGHKMYGPKGIGALYVNRALQERIEPLIYGGDQQRGLRPGTVPSPLCVGMAAAARIVRDAGTGERRVVGALRDSFVDALISDTSTVHLNGPSRRHRHPGNANLRFDGRDAQDILAAMQPQLAASTGAACASGIPEPSHVLRAIGLSSLGAGASVRFSFGRFTTKDEIASALRSIAEVLTRLR